MCFNDLSRSCDTQRVASCPTFRFCMYSTFTICVRHISSTNELNYCYFTNTLKSHHIWLFFPYIFTTKYAILSNNLDNNKIGIYLIIFQRFLVMIPRQASPWVIEVTVPIGRVSLTIRSHFSKHKRKSRTTVVFDYELPKKTLLCSQQIRGMHSPLLARCSCRLQACLYSCTSFHCLFYR